MPSFFNPILHQRLQNLKNHLRAEMAEALEDDALLGSKLHALTHILTSPTTNPSFHSQFFIASQIPCYLNWDYPPILCPNPSSPPFLLKWGLSLFLRKAARLGLPETSWRSKCPYLQPPPLILAAGVEPARWGHEEMKHYFRKRLRRKRLGNDVNPLVPLLIPNLVLFSLLLWDPFPP